MSELVSGILLALLAGTLLPFATAQASGWIESRRDLNRRRRELYEHALLVRLDEPPFIEGEDFSERQSKMVAHMKERNKARFALMSSFGLFDSKVAEATQYWGTHVSTREVNDIMRMWANGHRWTARRMARRALKAGITSPPQTESPTTTEDQRPTPPEST